MGGAQREGTAGRCAIPGKGRLRGAPAIGAAGGAHRARDGPAGTVGAAASRRRKLERDSRNRHPGTVVDRVEWSEEDSGRLRPPASGSSSQGNRGRPPRQAGGPTAARWVDTGAGVTETTSAGRTTTSATRSTPSRASPPPDSGSATRSSVSPTPSPASATGTPRGRGGADRDGCRRGPAAHRARAGELREPAVGRPARHRADDGIPRRRRHTPWRRGPGRRAGGQWPRASHSSRCGASAPIVVLSPWPVCTTVSTGRVSNRVRIDSMMVPKSL
ncbi:hypothetical protein GA0070613_4892 [Micromonospora inositola]|uniref:Uncharacterized protein n=1 Tax=Micromonospora inositola TaxID=47865 RepID=A0A1C5JLT1_9ACTN|nr:hypothetical protein GA0070613_4892 [Micromonospora inositola]